MAIIWSNESHIVIEGRGPVKIPTRNYRIATGSAAVVTVACAIAGAVSLLNTIIVKFAPYHHP